MKSHLTALLLAALCATALPSHAKDQEKPAMSASQIERMHKRNKRNAEEAWARDQKKRSREEFAEMEKDYQEINAKYREPQIMEILERFLKKYKEGNRVGCATLYLAQKSGGKDREKLLKQAVDDFSDAYYLNGCSVGGLARVYLAAYYKEESKDSAAKKLIEEIETDYKDAQDQNGKPIIEMLAELKK